MHYTTHNTDIIIIVVVLIVAAAIIFTAIRDTRMKDAPLEEERLPFEDNEEDK